MSVFYFSVASLQGVGLEEKQRGSMSHSLRMGLAERGERLAIVYSLALTAKLDWNQPKQRWEAASFHQSVSILVLPLPATGALPPSIGRWVAPNFYSFYI